jgi:hypothetical protein
MLTLLLAKRSQGIQWFRTPLDVAPTSHLLIIVRPVDQSLLCPRGSVSHLAPCEDENVRLHGQLYSNRTLLRPRSSCIFKHLSCPDLPAQYEASIRNVNYAIVSSIDVARPVESS